MHDISPEPIFKIISGHLLAKYLFVASRLGLFQTLGKSSLSLEQLSERISTPKRTTRILVDALLAGGLLQRQNDLYHNTPVTETFLSGESNDGLRPVLDLWDQVVYLQWTQLENALFSNQPAYGPGEFSKEQSAVFARGVSTLTAPSAKALIRAYDFRNHKRLLDLGGGTGNFSKMALREYSHLEATLFELPATAAIARQSIAKTPLEDRLEILEGDLFEAAELPHGYDTIIMANVVHLFSPEHNRQLLKKIHQSAEKGARLLLIDFWTDSSHTQPPFAALMAAEFQIYSGEGDVYSVEELNQWLHETGWSFVEHKPLAGAASLIIAEAY